jgi:hypothetical protein
MSTERQEDRSLLALICSDIEYNIARAQRGQCLAIEGQLTLSVSD